MHKRKGKGNGSGQRMYQRLFNEQLNKTNYFKDKVAEMATHTASLHKQVDELGEALNVFQTAEAPTNEYTVVLTEEEIIVLEDGDSGVADMIADQVLALARARSIIHQCKDERSKDAVNKTEH